MLDNLLDAAALQAGSRPRGMADLCHAFGISQETLYRWWRQGIPVHARELAADIAQRYELGFLTNDASPTEMP